MIFRGVNAALEARGNEIDKLQGRSVTVVGRVENNANWGWQIILKRPEHLTVE